MTLQSLKNSDRRRWSQHRISILFTTSIAWRTKPKQSDASPDVSQSLSRSNVNFWKISTRRLRSCGTLAKLAKKTRKRNKNSEWNESNTKRKRSLLMVRWLSNKKKRHRRQYSQKLTKSVDTTTAKSKKQTVKPKMVRNSLAKSIRNWQTFKRIEASGAKMLTASSLLCKAKRSFSISTMNSLLVSNKFSHYSRSESSVFLALASFWTRLESRTMGTFIRANRTQRTKKLEAISRNRTSSRKALHFPETLGPKVIRRWWASQPASLFRRKNCT